MKLILWILLILAAVICLVYLRLIAKRLILIMKIKATHPDSVEYVRSPFYSVFVPDGRTDIRLGYNGVRYDVSVLTTPFRKCRYHFVDNGIMEVIKGRKGMYIVNRQAPTAPTAQLDRVRIVKRCKLHLDDESGVNKIMLLHPAPMEISKVSGNGTESLGNNDSIYNGYKVCGLSFFEEYVGETA